MRIGIDARLWNETGVGRYVRNLIHNLEAIDKKNDYVVFAPPGVKIQSPKWKTVETEIRWHSAAEQIKFPQVINREKIDLMHFTYHSIPVFYNSPFVVTIHDLIPLHFATGEASSLPLPLYKLKLQAYKFVLQNAISKSKKIIVPSRAIKNEIIESFQTPPYKIIVTYEGSDLAKQSESTLSSNEDYFLYVGNAFPHKNLDVLLLAFKSIKPSFPKLKLFMVTKENYFYKKLKKRIRDLNLEESVVFHNNVDDKKLQSLYKNAKALILPSLAEGFGLPALEAMENNCLVLASDIPVLHEICTTSALFFNPRNIIDLEERMREALTLDFSKNKKEGNVRSKMFSWEKMARETLKVYESSFSLR